VGEGERKERGILPVPHAGNRSKDSEQTLYCGNVLMEKSVNTEGMV
jgi:hypothetical protein